MMFANSAQRRLACGTAILVIGLFAAAAWGAVATALVFVWVAL